MSTYQYKAPQDVVIPDVLPQERVTGDILKGRGPRRGNLERLLRYWRPIMKKDGGFRRCKVILADHPELFPLNNICAWLHHETTGLWPNEGCHHPTMKNCRKKIKKGINGSLWSDSQFSARIRKQVGKKSGMPEIIDDNADNVVTNDDIKHAMLVLRDFTEMEPEFCKMLSDDDNWEIEGEDATDGMTKSLPYTRTEGDCC